MRIVLLTPEKLVVERSLQLSFPVTNNEAEYEALLVEMTMIQKVGGKVVKVFSNSRLVVGHPRRIRSQRSQNSGILKLG